MGRAQKAEEESFGNRATRSSPAKSRGPLFPPHEPVTAGKALQSLEKFEAAAAWIPAFAGQRKRKWPIFSARSGYLPSLVVHSACLRGPAIFTGCRSIAAIGFRAGSSSLR